MPTITLTVQTYNLLPAKDRRTNPDGTRDARLGCGEWRRVVFVVPSSK
jgi:hypothetical protein